MGDWTLLATASGEDRTLLLRGSLHKAAGLHPLPVSGGNAPRFPCVSGLGQAPWTGAEMMSIEPIICGARAGRRADSLQLSIRRGKTAWCRISPRCGILCGATARRIVDQSDGTADPGGQGAAMMSRDGSGVGFLLARGKLAARISHHPCGSGLRLYAEGVSLPQWRRSCGWRRS